MTRPLLDLQLQIIRTKIIRLGSLVETALEQVLQAIESENQALCVLVIEQDRRIDEMRSEIERLAFRSLTLQQPLAGADLRFLSSAPAIIGDLERTGDNAAGIAKLLLRMTPLQMGETSHMPLDLISNTQKHRNRPLDSLATEAFIVSSLVALGQEALRMLQGTMQAFAQNDAQSACVIWQEDDVVDVRYHIVRHDSMTMLTASHAIPALQEDSRVMQRMTYWLWMAHNLERVGDHCTNICERIVFFLEGEETIKPSEEE